MKRFTSIFSTPPCGSYEYEVGECDFVTKNDGCSQYFYKDKRNGKHYKCKNSDSDGPDTHLCVQSKDICSFDRQEALQEELKIKKEEVKIKEAQQELDKFIQSYHLNQGDITQPILQHILNKYYSGRAPPQDAFALDTARYIIADKHNIDSDKLKIDPLTRKNYFDTLRSPLPPVAAPDPSEIGRTRSSTSAKRGSKKRSSAKRGSKKRSSTKRTSTTRGSKKRGSTKGGSKKRYTKKHTKRKNKCRR